MPKRIPNLFPRYGADRWWVYLVGRNDGDLKVGISRNPRTRLSNHRLAAHGMRWCHLFASAERWIITSTEREAIVAFAAIGTRHGRTEVFSGIDKRTALVTVRELLTNQRELWAGYAAESAARKAEQAHWQAFRARYIPLAACEKQGA